jgi:hypothetical protein
VNRVPKTSHFGAHKRGIIVTTFFRHKFPSPVAEGICGEKMFAGARCAGPGNSAKVVRFESAVDGYMMELHEFIRRTIEQVMSAVKESHEHAKMHGGSVGSDTYTDVEFNIVVSTSETGAAKGGAGTFVGSFGIGGQASKDSSSSSESRIKFTVPVGLPATHSMYGKDS